MTALYLFASTFVLVCALGLQSLNVNQGRYVWAFCTSIVISASQIVLLKLAPDASWLEIAGFMSGGPFGIVTAMRLQPWLTRTRRNSEIPPRRMPTAPPINRVIFHGERKP